MKKIFTGRKEEYDILQELLDKPGSELVAVLGRRRIGKTYLVKQAYATQLCFHFTGIKDATKKHYAGSIYR